MESTERGYDGMDSADTKHLENFGGDNYREHITWRIREMKLYRPSDRRMSAKLVPT
jgi:hypothetical protein